MVLSFETPLLERSGFCNRVFKSLLFNACVVVVGRITIGIARPTRIDGAMHPHNEPRNLVAIRMSGF
ncbi:hypothetical protein PsorP6_019016 [Peronosclerospora sorghi]|nr:hypothetical protein PsorP6_019016 [Peronosclerospora sorghi]